MRVKLLDRYSESDLRTLLESYTLKGLSSQDIAKAIGSSERTISRWRKHFGLNKPAIVSFSSDEALELHDKGLTCNEIAKRCGVSVDTVSRRLSSKGVTLDRTEGIRRSNARRHEALWPDIERDLNNGFLKMDIVSKYNISAPSLNRLLKIKQYTPRYNVDINDVYEAISKIKSSVSSKRRKAGLKYMNGILDYVDQYNIKPTCSDLSRHLECSVQTVSSWFSSNNYNYLFRNTSYGLSHLARYMCDLLDDRGLYYELNNREILRPYEIDIWVPSLNLGFEINPTTSHNIDKNRRSDISIDYHQQKSLLSLDHGIRLIHIYDWDVGTIEERIDNLLHPDVVYNDSVFILDLDKPVTTEYSLILNNFYRYSVEKPKPYMVNYNTGKLVDNSDKSTVRVYPAGLAIYKRK